MKAARQKAARDAVEVIEVAKARLDHGKQTLAIFRQKALRLASVAVGGDQGRVALDAKNLFFSQTSGGV